MKRPKIFIPSLLLFAVNAILLTPLLRGGKTSAGGIPVNPAALLAINLVVLILTFVQYGWTFALIPPLLEERPLDLWGTLGQAPRLGSRILAVGICISILITVLWLLSAALFSFEAASLHLRRGLSGPSEYLVLFGLFIGFLLVAALMGTIFFLLLASPFAGPVLALERVGPLTALKIIVLFVKDHLLFALGMALVSGFILILSLVPLWALLLLKGTGWFSQIIRQSAPLYLLGSQFYSLLLMGISTLFLIFYSLGYARRSTHGLPGGTPVLMQ